MDPGETLLRFLDQAAQDSTIPFEQRDGATYIATLFRTTRNTSRLIVQLDALLRGEKVVGIPSSKPDTHYSQIPVQRYGKYLHAAVAEFDVTPTVADFEGHPVTLSDNLEQNLKAVLDADGNSNVHRAFLVSEQKANSHLARFTAKYGYHYIFRIGLRQYYMT